MMKKVKVLFFTADPKSVASDVPRLRLDEELREIFDVVEWAERVESLEFNTCPAARPRDMLRCLKRYRPQVVHFSCHASPAGLVLVGAAPHRGQTVEIEALVKLFKRYRGNIRLVVLNACESLPIAEALAEVVGCAIGVRKKIEDQTAIDFAREFYCAIAAGHSVEAAVEDASFVLPHPDLPDCGSPELTTREGTDASRVFVVRSRQPMRMWAGASLAGAIALGFVALALLPPRAPPCAWAGPPKAVVRSRVNPVIGGAGTGTEIARAKADYEAGQYSRAFPKFRQLAANRNAEAMGFVGEMFLHGQGTPVQKDSGLYWLHKAADKNDPNAMTLLGSAYESGDGVRANPRWVVHWYARAANDEQWPEAMHRLGLFYHATGKHAAAFRHLRDAATSGSLEARVDVGQMYEQGEATHPDTAMAVCLYRTAADAGSARGMFALGRVYEEGIGVSEDREEAVEWYRKAAEAGLADAREALARLRAR